MKQIPLKIVDMVVNNQTIKLSYKAQLMEVIKNPSTPQGADYDEMRRSIRLLDLLEAATGDDLSIEDADFEYLKQRILLARWPFIDKVVQNFIEDVTLTHPNQ
jgi:hypothetical protein